jgi:hypothetical protein
MANEDGLTESVIAAAEREFLKFLGISPEHRGMTFSEGAAEDSRTSTITPSAQHPAPAIPVKDKKTAEELAAMLHQELSQIEGCPQRGVKVTVYGLSPWNSMLMFGVEAGGVPNKADLQRLCEQMTERLKRLYDVLDVEPDLGT